jgi:glycosyltransferase involved in cell wall biosynthesis
MLHIVTPAKSNVHGSFVKCIQRVLQSMHDVTFELCTGKSNIVHARSITMTRWYDKAGPDDLFLFIDSDQTFTPDDVRRAMELPDCDVACGIYANSAGEPNAYMMDLEAFCDHGKNDKMLYGGTGFMLVRKSICDKIVKYIEDLDGGSRFAIDGVGVVPFFRTRLVEPEGNLKPTNMKHWLGEDYSFCWMVRQCGGVIRGFISPTLGHEVLNVRYFCPPNYTGKTWKPGSIVYLCGHSLVRFDPTEKHLGGSEKAVVQLCKRWAKTHEVTVFGNVNKGVYDGVDYRPMEEFNKTDKFDTIIAWRSFGCVYLPDIKAKTILVDLHDNSSRHDKMVGILAHKVFLKSLHHRELKKSVPDGKVCVIPNGIDDEVFQASSGPFRMTNRFIYASSYDRGLEDIVKNVWPKIRVKWPTAELHCFYGMELLDEEDRTRLQCMFDEDNGVFDHGRVTIDELIIEKQKAAFHLYPTDTDAEIDCISIRESALLGCIPIIKNKGVFKERKGIPFDDSIFDNKKMRRVRQDIQKSAMESEPTWDDVARTWLRFMPSGVSLAT